jgi:hypothetical protein
MAISPISDNLMRLLVRAAYVCEPCLYWEEQGGGLTKDEWLAAQTTPDPELEFMETCCLTLVVNLLNLAKAEASSSILMARHSVSQTLRESFKNHSYLLCYLSSGAVDACHYFTLIQVNQEVVLIDAFLDQLKPRYVTYPNLESFLETIQRLVDDPSRENVLAFYGKDLWRTNQHEGYYFRCRGYSWTGRFSDNLELVKKPELREDVAEFINVDQTPSDIKTRKFLSKFY